MTDPYDVDTKDITIPERPPRYFRVQLRVALHAWDPDDRLVSSGLRLVSVSASGIGFVPTHALSQGDRLRMEFDLRDPGASVSVAVEAEVVRVVDDDFELYVGCRFVDFDQRKQQALLKALEAVRAQQAADAA